MRGSTKALRAVMYAGVMVMSVRAWGVAPRAYVSVNGNDANTCNVPTTPCRTFVGAISELTPGGEVIVLDSGTFGGGTITQAVTINGPAGVAVLAATPLVINAGVSDVVTLRGLTFVSPTPGSGTALTFSGGAGLNLENCIFHGWATGLNFAAPGKLNVTDTTVRDNGTYGMYLNASGLIQASFDRTRFLGNNYGLWVASGAKASMRGSVVSGNSIGIYTSSNDSSNPELTIEQTVVTNNSSWGIASTGGVLATTRVSNSTVTNNGTGLFQSGSGVLLSRVNNTVEGNSSDTSGSIGSFTAK